MFYLVCFSVGKNDFFGEYLLICLFLANHQERDLFHLCGQVLRLFRGFFINFIVDSLTMGHPNERAVRKLRFYESIHENTSCVFVHVTAHLQERGTFYLLFQKYSRKNQN